MDDLKAALQRRGPDSLGSKKVFLCSKTSGSAVERQIISFVEEEEAKERGKLYLQHLENKNDCLFDSNGQTHELENCFRMPKFVAELHFIGATLQLRGVYPIVQPLMDTSGNILVYNGMFTCLCFG